MSTCFQAKKADRRSQRKANRMHSVVSVYRSTPRNYSLKLKGRSKERPLCPINAFYWQLGNLNDAIHVLQLNVPLFFRYSVVYQKVQLSTGSTAILE